MVFSHLLLDLFTNFSYRFDIRVPNLLGLHLLGHKNPELPWSFGPVFHPLTVHRSDRPSLAPHLPTNPVDCFHQVTVVWHIPLVDEQFS